MTDPHRSAADPRWDRLRANNATCACCGLPTNALFSFAYDRPSVFPSDTPIAENWMLLQQEGDILTEDFCRLDQYRFVRCILEIPIVGLTDVLTIGVWSTLSQENFDAFVEHFDTGTQASLGVMGSWLSNPVPADAQLPISVILRPKNDRQRPTLHFQDDHPLSQIQRTGLGFDELADLLAGFGHEIGKTANH